MKVLFIGGSSFSGFWLCRFLSEVGHEVVMPLTRGMGEYEGLRRERLIALGDLGRLVPSASLGSEGFLLLVQAEPWDVFCHHGAKVGNHKSPDFDVAQALENNTRGLGEVLAAFGEGGCRKVVLSGTTFENGEGAGAAPLRAFSPYGSSKGLTAEVFQNYCPKQGMSLGKFVIPNPFGPWEDKGIAKYLIETWLRGEVAQVRTPDYVRDTIPVDLLARCYGKFVEDLPETPGHFEKMNPSGYVETVGAFAQRMARELGPRLGVQAELTFCEQTEFTEPRERSNTQPATELVPDWDESAFWDGYAEYSLERWGR